MPADLNILVLASYFKGERFIEQAARRGARVHLLTRERHVEKAWPRSSLAAIYGQGDDATIQDQLYTVSYLARSVRIDRIVPMDDYDVETAATLREHLRVPGMGDTTARHFRDKLAMRLKAKEAGIPVPEFVGVFNYDAIRELIARVPPPWMFKPRSEASASGITKVESAEQLWSVIDSKGDRQSYFLLEKYLPGDVYHVDSIVFDRKVLFSAVHRCGKPPFDVAHGGGLFTTSTVERGSADEAALRDVNEKVLTTMNLVRGVSHVEFIKHRDDGRFYMLECAARVGGAHIAELVEAANGLNLWEEWANLEINDALRQPYALPPVREEYGGLLMTLSRQETPDLAWYADPEVFYRAPEANHAGLVVRSPAHARIQALLESYTQRFYNDFFASLPAAARPVN